MGITPLLYKAGAEHGWHAKLGGALKVWAEQTALRPADIAERLQQILANPDLRSKSDEDFVSRHYCREETVAAFIEHARSFDWVEWMHSRGLIKPLLSEAGTTTTEAHLSFWIGTMLASDKTGAGFAMMSECGGRMNADVARGLFLAILNAIKVDAPDLSQKEWLRILFQQPHSVYMQLHSQMAAHLQRHKEWILVLALLTYIVRPYIDPGDSRGTARWCRSVSGTSKRKMRWASIFVAWLG